jgi:hypothetical protein
LSREWPLSLRRGSAKVPKSKVFCPIKAFADAAPPRSSLAAYSWRFAVNRYAVYCKTPKSIDAAGGNAYATPACFFAEIPNLRKMTVQPKNGHMVRPHYLLLGSTVAI